MPRETRAQLRERYRQALLGLRFIAGATDDLLVHEILDETFEALGESKHESEGPAARGKADHMGMEQMDDGRFTSEIHWIPPQGGSVCYDAVILLQDGLTHETVPCSSLIEAREIARRTLGNEALNPKIVNLAASTGSGYRSPMDPHMRVEAVDRWMGSRITLMLDGLMSELDAGLAALAQRLDRELVG